LVRDVVISAFNRDEVSALVVLDSTVVADHPTTSVGRDIAQSRAIPGPARVSRAVCVNSWGFDGIVDADHPAIFSMRPLSIDHPPTWVNVHRQGFDPSACGARSPQPDLIDRALSRRQAEDVILP